MLASLRRSAPSTERRYSQVLPWGPWNIGGSPSVTGVHVNESSAVQLATVYGAVSLISDTIATLPTDVYQRTDDVPRIVNKPAWLEQPNPTTDIIEFLTQSLWSLLLAGNCYWVRGIDLRAVTTGLTVLDPCRVTPKLKDGGVVYEIDGKPFAGRIIHIKGITRPGEVVGFSPLEAARQSIGLGLAAQEFAARFYGNGASLSGFISTEADLTEEQARQLQDSWASAHSGLANAHKPGVLDNAATWTPVTVTPEQAQFLQSRNFQSAEICGQIFLLDPTLLGIPLQSNSLTYANLEQRGIHLVQFSLLRWLVRLERAISSLLPRSQFYKFNVAGLERADLKTRYEAYKVGLDAGFLQVNEPREKEDLKSLPDQLQISQEDAETIGSLIRAGYEANSVIAAVTTGNLNALTHTGQLPVTVQPVDRPQAATPFG